MNPKRSGLQPQPESLIKPGDGGQLHCGSLRYPEERTSGGGTSVLALSVQSHPTIPLRVSRSGGFAFPEAGEA